MKVLLLLLLVTAVSAFNECGLGTLNNCGVHTAASSGQLCCGRNPVVRPCYISAATSATAVTTTCGPCPAGYTANNATHCVDINECLDGNNGGCDSRTTCTNTQGSRVCGACPTGFRGTGATRCIDLDEC